MLNSFSPLYSSVVEFLNLIFFVSNVKRESKREAGDRMTPMFIAAITYKSDNELSHGCSVTLNVTINC